mmetsp:Transcript_150799/g.482657  ORF Transcript_150799/g.482657 Transcript_150799/m.482657 type:complete len:247 (-) Transcript_150799:26-766(-)
MTSPMCDVALLLLTPLCFCCDSSANLSPHLHALVNQDLGRGTALHDHSHVCRPEYRADRWAGIASRTLRRPLPRGRHRRQLVVRDRLPEALVELVGNGRRQVIGSEASLGKGLHPQVARHQDLQHLVAPVMQEGPGLPELADEAPGAVFILDRIQSRSLLSEVDDGEAELGERILALVLPVRRRLPQQSRRRDQGLFEPLQELLHRRVRHRRRSRRRGGRKGSQWRAREWHAAAAAGCRAGHSGPN